MGFDLSSGIKSKRNCVPLVVCRIARCVQVGGVHIQIMGKLSRKPPTRVTRGALYPGHTIPLLTLLYHAHCTPVFSLQCSVTRVYVLYPHHTPRHSLQYPHANRDAFYHIVHQYSVQPTGWCIGVTRGAFYPGSPPPKPTPVFPMSPPLHISLTYVSLIIYTCFQGPVMKMNCWISRLCESCWRNRT